MEINENKVIENLIKQYRLPDFFPRCQQSAKNPFFATAPGSTWRRPFHRRPLSKVKCPLLNWCPKVCSVSLQLLVSLRWHIKGSRTWCIYVSDVERLVQLTSPPTLYGNTVRNFGLPRFILHQAFLDNFPENGGSGYVVDLLEKWGILEIYLEFWVYS